MVERQEFDEEIKEMVRFYLGLPEKVREADKHYALLPKESAENIITLLKQYYLNPKNTYLKRLHANLMTLVRGVEGFNDEAIHQKHEYYGKLCYKIFETIENKIKW
jgi:DNA primase